MINKTKIRTCPWYKLIIGLVCLLLFLNGVILFAATTQLELQMSPFLAPSNLTATAVSPYQIDLNWSSVSDAVSYKVYREGVSIASPITTSYSDTGLTPVTIYSYAISAVNIYGGESAQSSSVSATTPGVGGGGLLPAAYSPPTPPAEGFRVVINDDALETDSREVTITLNGGSDTARMAISNFSDFRYAVQEPYQTTKTWVLIVGEGLKTVYAKFFTSWGQASEVVLDAITLAVSPTPLPLTPEAKKVDVNDDGSINILDFNILIINWRATTPCNVADFNDDGIVDILDILIINWGATTPCNVADFNDDGIVDILDFNLLMIHWQI